MWLVVFLVVAGVAHGRPLGRFARERERHVQEMSLPLVGSPTPGCPCKDPSLCEPVQVLHGREVFGFGSTDWEHFDWDVVTTIAWATTDPDLLCHAHSRNVRLIASPPNPIPFTDNATVRREWIDKTLAMVKGRFFDGITFDYESPMEATSPDVLRFVQLVRETTDRFHAELPGSQVSVCVAWSPDSIDGRSYDYTGLGLASDLLYVMMYDTRSQIFDRCLASANAGIPMVQRGIQEYLRIGVPKEKLVLGLPWYGYSYPCTTGLSAPLVDYCPIEFVPFRGVNCSDAAGREIAFSSIMGLLDGGNTTTKRRYERGLESPYYNYIYTTKKGVKELHQMWYDDAESLAVKYQWAKQMGLRGTGPFTYSDLDPLGKLSPKGPEEAKAMWAALGAFRQP